MTEKTLGKTRLSGQERRASIVEAAIKLFSEKGFRGTTTRELAASIGVSEPVLYEHFRTKWELYRAIIAEKSQEGLGKIEALRDQYLEADDDRGFFTVIATIVLEWYIQNPDYVRLMMFSCLEGHELKDVLHEQQTKAFFSLITSYIQHRIDVGGLRDGINAEFTAHLFTGMVAHYGTNLVLFASSVLPLSRTDVIDRMVDVMLDGISKKDQPQ